AFNSADVRSARDSGVDQIASWRKPQEVSEVNAAVGVAHDGGRETDEIGRAHDQAFSVDAHTVFPPAVGAGDVRAGGMVAVGPLEGKVVGKDVSAFGEIDVLIAVSPRGVVRYRDAARIGVVSEAVLLIPESDRTTDDVIDRNVIATQFEAVGVAVGGRRAVREHTVVVGDAILDGNWTDGPRIALREEVPAVVNVVVRDAPTEHVAGSRRQLAGEAVGVLAVVRVEVVVGSAIENQVVGGPVTLRGGR